jgi:hypothetical protein
MTIGLQRGKDRAALLNVAREVSRGQKSEWPIRAGLPAKHRSRQATNELFVGRKRDDFCLGRQFLESDRGR